MTYSFTLRVKFDLQTHNVEFKGDTAIIKQSSTGQVVYSFQYDQVALCVTNGEFCVGSLSYKSLFSISLPITDERSVFLVKGQKRFGDTTRYYLVANNIQETVSYKYDLTICAISLNQTKDGILTIDCPVEEPSGSLTSPSYSTYQKIIGVGDEQV